MNAKALIQKQRMSLISSIQNMPAIPPSTADENDDGGNKKGGKMNDYLPSTILKAAENVNISTSLYKMQIF